MEQHKLKPEEKTREKIDGMLKNSGWKVAKNGQSISQKGAFAVEEYPTKSGPVDFLRDIIKFIKNFEEIDAPKYLKEEYLKLNDKLKPYDDRFVASELYSSERFKPKFDEFVEENKIAVVAGSLTISSNDLDRNFVFTREVAEKIIFPVMRKVPGRKDFIEIIKEEL